MQPSRMNSFAKPLRLIAEFAALGTFGTDGVGIAAAIEFHLTFGWSLDRAFTVAHSNYWRTRRDSLLFEYAARYCRDGRLLQRAAKLRSRILVYQRGTWRHDRRQAEMPSNYLGSHYELLFQAFAANTLIEPARDMPSSPKRLAQILSGSAGDGIEGNAPPMPTSVKDVFNASNDGDRTNAREKIPTSHQWRRQAGRS